jgi:thiamine-phosphate pyrophosphorylase
MFGSRSKTLALPPRGLAALREICAALPAPVVAIGGITEGTVADVAAAGAACAAVIDDLFGRGDPEARARILAARFEEGRRRRA